MKFKLFSASTRKRLEDEVNEWLSKNLDVRLDTMKFQYQATPHDDRDSYNTEHSLAIFYPIMVSGEPDNEE